MTASEATLPSSPIDRQHSGGWRKKFRVLLLSSLTALLCLVVADLLYCAHIRHRTSLRAHIGYDTTPAEIVRLLGEPDLKQGGKWNKWIYRYHEPETMTADSMMVWFLLTGSVEFRRCTFTVEFEEAGMGMRVSSRYEGYYVVRAWWW